MFMLLFFIQYIKILTPFRLIISFLLIILILLRKADEEDLNLSIIPFSDFQKSDNFIDKIIWSLILIFFILQLIFSTKTFS
jgi:protein translocase SecG subunit